MNNIIIRRSEKNIYEIKVLDYINIHNINTLKELIKNIINKIKKKYYLRKEIVLDIYPSKYETIIILKDYNKYLSLNNNTEIKINIHTNTTFLYQINYNDIPKSKGNIYYYKKKFYLKIKNITKKEYLKLSEYSNLIYQDTDTIIDNAIKIKL